MQGAASVANSFRDIVILMDVFQVSGCGGCVRYDPFTDILDGYRAPCRIHS